MPYYPQSNGEDRTLAKSLKGECIRPGTPLSRDDARRLVESYVEHYNNVRLNSAIGYITPKDMLAGRQQEIHAERDRKLEAARKQRQIRREHPAYPNSQLAHRSKKTGHLRPEGSNARAPFGG
jgi:putative transposase